MYHAPTNKIFGRLSEDSYIYFPCEQCGNFIKRHLVDEDGKLMLNGNVDMYCNSCNASYILEWKETEKHHYNFDLTYIIPKKIVFSQDDIFQTFDQKV